MNSGANLWSPKVEEAIYAAGRDYMTQHWADAFGSVVDVAKDGIESYLDIEDPLDPAITHRIAQDGSLARNNSGYRISGWYP
jgi:hypothetical protein